MLICGSVRASCLPELCLNCHWPQRILRSLGTLGQGQRGSRGLCKFSHEANSLGSACFLHLRVSEVLAETSHLTHPRKRQMENYRQECKKSFSAALCCQELGNCWSSQRDQAK